MNFRERTAYTYAVYNFEHVGPEGVYLLGVLTLTNENAT